MQPTTRHPQGFTLLEMTIALGIFVVLFTMTLGIYNYSLQAEQRTIQLSKLQKEAQFIMEIVAKKIRSGLVNYTFYTTNNISLGSNGVTILALLDSSGNPTVFKFESDSLKVCTSGCDSYDDFYAIPPADVTVSDLKFFITPYANPFGDINAPPDEFPKVTVVLELENTRAGTTRTLSVQQTIPQRLAGF